MPARRRTQEAKRALRRLDRVVEQVQVEIDHQDMLDHANPLDDLFWDEHQNPEKYLCSCYSDRTTAALLADAREEVKEFRAAHDASRVHVTRQRVTR